MKLGIIGPAKGPGQLGMLLALAANNIHCNGEANLEILTIGDGIAPDWSDEHYGISESEINEFKDLCQIITFETESISEVFRDTFKDKLVPSLNPLNIFRNRVEEKNFFAGQGFKTAKFFVIKDEESLQETIKQVSELDTFKGRLKTVELGYDGHGQIKINSFEEIENAWQKLGKVTCILEEEVKIHQELSVIVTRFVDGNCVFYPVPQNKHNNGILYRSKASELKNEKVQELQQITKKIVDKLNYVGTFCIETFQIDGPDGEILLNEAAPRVHNSGHYTLNACDSTNQFDSHIRAICSLSPESTGLIEGEELVRDIRSKQPFYSMTNLLGLSLTQFEFFKEEIRFVLDSEEMKKHNIECNFFWYGKTEPKAGRKMGHVTVTAETKEILEQVEELIDQLISAQKN